MKTFVIMSWPDPKVIRAMLSTSLTTWLLLKALEPPAWNTSSGTGNPSSSSHLPGLLAQAFATVTEREELYAAYWEKVRFVISPNAEGSQMESRGDRDRLFH